MPAETAAYLELTLSHVVEGQFKHDLLKQTDKDGVVRRGTGLKRCPLAAVCSTSHQL